MNDEELNKLAELLDKLQAHIGNCRNVSVINNYVQDGYYVGVYDLNGNIDTHRSQWSITLPMAVKSIVTGVRQLK